MHRGAPRPGLTITELAAVAGFNAPHFKPLFREAVGKSVHRFVFERLLERARWLRRKAAGRLQEGRSNVTDVALETGFAHASHKARCIRQVLDASPSQIAARDR